MQLCINEAVSCALFMLVNERIFAVHLVLSSAVAHCVALMFRPSMTYRYVTMVWKNVYDCMFCVFTPDCDLQKHHPSCTTYHIDTL